MLENSIISLTVADQVTVAISLTVSNLIIIDLNISRAKADDNENLYRQTIRGEVLSFQHHGQEIPTISKY